MTGALSLLCGTLLGLGAAAPVSIAWMATAALLAACGACSPWRRDAAMSAGALLLAGMVLAGFHAQRWESLRVAVTGTDQRGLLDGRVVTVPERDGAIWRFEVEGKFVAGDVTDARTRRVRLYWRDFSYQPRVGERWRLLMRFAPFEQVVNFDGLDVARLSFRDGVHAAGRVVPSSLNARLELASQSIHGVRARIASRVADAIADPDGAALVTALAVGLTAGMSTDQWRVFNATGTTHLVAISGLHVTLFAWLSFRLARLLWRWLPAGTIEREPFAWCLGLAAAGGYALLAGFSVPAQRTWLMLGVYVAAGLSCRHVGAGRLWSLALVVVLLRDPVAALSAGFWLSFVAVGVLLLSGQTSPVRTQLAVMLALAPAGFAVFGSMSLVGLAVNLIAIPVISFVFVPIVLAGALGSWLLPALGAPFFDIAAVLYEALWPALTWCADLPHATWRVVPPRSWYFVALPAVWVGLCQWPWPLRFTAGVAALPLAFAMPGEVPTGEARIIVLDAGRGTAVWIRTRSHSLLFDTGDAWGTRGSRLREVVLPLLDSAAMDVDLQILPSLDADRANAVALLAFERGIGRVLAGAGWPGARLPVERCRDSRWHWDGVDFHTFVAGRGGRHCVLRVATEGGSMLLAGDVDAAAERTLLARVGEALHADIALVSRQASAGASSRQWIEAISPGLAIATGGIDGARSRVEVMDRWRAVSAVIDTRALGAVKLELGADRAEVAAIASEVRYPFVWRRALRYDPGHVGNSEGRRPVHVPDHRVFHRAGRHRPRTTLDPAAQTRVAAGAHQEGVAASGCQPGQHQGHRRAGEELAAGPGARHRARQPPSRARHHDGACRGCRPSRGARARALRQFGGHHREHLALVRPAGNGHRHHRRVPGRHARRHG